MSQIGTEDGQFRLSTGLQYPHIVQIYDTELLSVGLATLSESQLISC